jgi:Tfp pilus assembly protein PilX
MKPQEVLHKAFGRRGSTLLAVLLILVVLLLLGMAFLTQQTHLYGAASQAQSAVAARAIAESGLEDARAKLEKDVGFPPAADPTQETFTYSEVLTDITDTDPVGQYTVTIDLSKKEKNGIISVTSVGSLARDNQVRRVLYGEIDVSGDMATNSKFYRFVHFEDRGGL